MRESMTSGRASPREPTSSGAMTPEGTWPAGQLMPDLIPDVGSGAAVGHIVKAGSWAWRTLRSATVELQELVDGVLDDLEGLGVDALHPPASRGADDSDPSERGMSSSDSCASEALGYGGESTDMSADEEESSGAADGGDLCLRAPSPVESVLTGLPSPVLTGMLLPLPPQPVSLRRVESEAFELVNFEDCVEVGWGEEDGP